MNIIIADDHALFRETLEEYLKRKLPEVNATVTGDCAQVVQMLEDGAKPDLIILDYSMRGMKQGAVKVQLSSS